MSEGTITEGQILTGVMFNEPMRVVTARASGAGAVEVTLTAEDIAQLNAIDSNASYDGDGNSSNSLCRPTPWASPMSATPVRALLSRLSPNPLPSYCGLQTRGRRDEAEGVAWTGFILSNCGPH